MIALVLLEGAEPFDWRFWHGTSTRRAIPQWPLSRSRIETKLILQGRQPIIGMVHSIERGNGVLGQLDRHTIAPMQWLSMLSVKGDACFRSSV